MWAERVEKLLATALEGKSAEENESQAPGVVPTLDADLIRVLAERLSKDDQTPPGFGRS
jgi:hypothetical protein